MLSSFPASILGILPAAAVILCHHAITLVLLAFALRHPDFAYWTCVDALVELNTALLVS